MRNRDCQHEEILQKSNLKEKAKDAIKTISKGGTPSGNQVARPDQSPMGAAEELFDLKIQDN